MLVGIARFVGCDVTLGAGAEGLLAVAVLEGVGLGVFMLADQLGPRLVGVLAGICDEG